MKNMNVRRAGTLLLSVVLLMMFLAVPAFAAGTENTFDDVVDPIVALINDLLGPILAVVGAVGTLYCVLLGVKYAKAEEPQDREKAKGHLKSAIIGFVLIFVLMLALKLTMPILQDWVSANS